MHPNEEKDEHYWVFERRPNGTEIISNDKDRTKVLDASALYPDGYRIRVDERNGASTQEFTINQQYELILHDPFISYEESIFSLVVGLPYLGNETLRLFTGHMVTSNPIILLDTLTYRFTLENLNGEVFINIDNIYNNIIDFPTQVLRGNGSSVSFHYTYGDSANIGYKEISL